MIHPDALRAVPCQFAVPTYASLLKIRDEYFKTAVNPFAEQSAEHANFENYRTVMRRVITLELKAPLAALRRQVAGLVEGFFREKGERTLIFGCMHSKTLSQTQTSLIDLLPQSVCKAKEDHTHPSAVTIDYRYSPTALYDLRLEAGGSLLVSDNGMNEIPKTGPDFARRNFQNPSDLDDFQFVENVSKIYAERIPLLEKGTFNRKFSNVFFFEMAHKMLAKGGILAFDYIPYFSVRSLNNQRETYFTTVGRRIASAKIKVSDQEVQTFLNNSTEGSYLKANLDTSNSPVPLFNCQDHQTTCPSNPCPSVVKKVARSVLVKRKTEKTMSELLEAKREKVKKLPKAVLKTDEVLFETEDNTLCHLIHFVKHDPKEDFLKKLKSSVINIRTDAKRTQEELDSLYYQVEAYETLNVAPKLIDQIHPETKRVLDLALVTLVNKVVFPQLKMLHFEGVAFDPNKQNPENKRPYERVVYAKKIEVA